MIVRAKASTSCLLTGSLPNDAVADARAVLEGFRDDSQTRRRRGPVGGAAHIDARPAANEAGA